MSVSPHDLKAALASVRTPWDEAAAERALPGLQRKRRLRKRRRLQGMAAVTAAGFLVAGYFMAGRRPQTVAVREPQIVAPAPRGAPGRVLYDGSRIVALGEASAVDVDEDGPARISARIVRGGGRFFVTKNRARPFIVHANGVTVTALGTVFTVQIGGPQVAVAVEEGRVSVQWPGGVRELSLGEAGRFETSPPVPPPRPTPAVDPQPSPRPPVAARRPAKWLALANEQNYRDSYEMLKQAPDPTLSPEELWRAADVARLSGHPREAVPYLERLLRDHPGDARAAQAAFSLGRVLLNLIEDPAGAARRFAESRALAPSSTLAQDALAREVEAWAKAGERDKARVRAEEYLRLYPEGQRREAVKQLAGVP